MHLMQLQIQNFRNLTEINFEPVDGVNLITGLNASGKTSLLEAIYYLSHLRSFRTHQISDLIKHQSTELQLVAKIHTDSNNQIPLGIKRSRHKLEVRANRQPIKRVADIATLFPVLTIHPDSYKLITGSPSERRQYMDWGVFHVEHDFFGVWQRFKRALSQRNAALKSRQNDDYCSLWDKELFDMATYIDNLRSKYLSNLQSYLNNLMLEFFKDQSVEVTYKRGWNNEASLDSLLKSELNKDRLKGFTQYGPHRAELSIKVDGQSAQTGISRGQQKTLVALLRLAQAQQFTESTGRNCILLYDDLAAELDLPHRKKILKVLSKMKTQLFLTSIEIDQVDLSAWDIKKMFHVEQGKLKDLI
ncbi:MAG: DNA replication/repair protein RecF [Gammaproteobacteria bacterium]|nr:DNA replication/repair protein RecF [Gammaproteobacteria bacterium]